MKRILFILLTGLLTLPATARKNVYEGFDIYGLEKTKTSKKNILALDLGVGKEIKVGLRLQHNFGRYVAWDILAFKYTYDWSEENWYYDNYYGDSANEIALTTGIRGFTPAFASGKLKGVASFAFGYGRSWNKCHDYYYYGSSHNDFKTEANHCAIDLTVGLQISDRIFLGYGFGAMEGNSYCDKIEHSLRLSLNF